MDDALTLAFLDPFSQSYVSKPSAHHGGVTITNALEAAECTARYGPDNGLHNHIDAALKGSQIYKAWRKAMPATRPPAIATYQTKYAKRNDASVDTAILGFGDTLSVGQTLFHAGLWTGRTTSILTSRPLSTSLSPIVAFQNALWKGKAYDAGRLDLLVLTMATPTTKGFVFSLRGKHGKEREVLLAANATLTLVKTTCVRPSYPVTKYNYPNKSIPIHVVEAEVS